MQLLRDVRSSDWAVERQVDVSDFSTYVVFGTACGLDDAPFSLWLWAFYSVQDCV